MIKWDNFPLIVPASFLQAVDQKGNSVIWGLSIGGENDTDGEGGAIFEWQEAWFPLISTVIIRRAQQVQIVIVYVQCHFPLHRICPLLMSPFNQSSHFIRCFGGSECLAQVRTRPATRCHLQFPQHCCCPAKQPKKAENGCLAKTSHTIFNYSCAWSSSREKEQTNKDVF